MLSDFPSGLNPERNLASTYQEVLKHRKVLADEVIPMLQYLEKAFGSWMPNPKPDPKPDPDPDNPGGDGTTDPDEPNPPKEEKPREGDVVVDPDDGKPRVPHEKEQQEIIETIHRYRDNR